MSNFVDKAAMNEALATLYRYRRSMYMTVEIPSVDLEKLEEYFDAETPARIAQFEKMIGAAAIEAIYMDPDIPAKYKSKVARRASEELQQAFRGAKVEYEFAVGKYGVGQSSVRKYEHKKKQIYICRKAALIDKVKRDFPKQATKMLAKHGLKTALASAGFTVGGLAGAAVGFLTGLAVDAVWYLIPPKKKETVKKKFGEIAEKACKVVNTVCDRVKNSPVVQKAKQVVDTYIAPVVRPVYEKAKEVATTLVESTGNALKKGWKKIKACFA